MARCFIIKVTRAVGKALAAVVIGGALIVGVAYLLGSAFLWLEKTGATIIISVIVTSTIIVIGTRDFIHFLLKTWRGCSDLDS